MIDNLEFPCWLVIHTKTIYAYPEKGVHYFDTYFYEKPTSYVRPDEVVVAAENLWDAFDKVAKML